MKRDLTVETQENTPENTWNLNSFDLEIAKKATIIIWELHLSFQAVTDIMRCLWNYRTDFHCSSCWQTLLSWGCGRTTDQSHMEYAEMLLCRNRRFNSSCRIKSPDVNTMLTEANRMQMSSWWSNIITDAWNMLTCSNTNETNMFGGGSVLGERNQCQRFSRINKRIWKAGKERDKTWRCSNQWKSRWL